MRILLVTQYFYPENFKSNDLAFELSKRGESVDAMVGIPNYPEGVYFKGYGIFRKRHEVINGVNIYRVFQTPRGRKASAIGLSLNYLSFVFSGLVRVFFQFLWKRKYDAIIVYEPSPITQMIPAIILGKLTNVKVFSWVTDIWPDSVIHSIGPQKAARIVRPLNYITNWVYKHSDTLLISSKRMKELINRDADYSDKIVYYPHWCDDMLKMPVDNDIPSLPKGFIIMMAGNINSGIGIEGIIECMSLLRDIDDLHFVFIGGGTLEHEFKEKIVKYGLRNVHVLGRFPFSKMPAFYEKADAMFLSLEKTKLPHLRATVPSRMQSYMSAGKPILAMIDGAAAEIIEEANCGYAVPAGDAKGLSDYIRNCLLLDKDSFRQKGCNARIYFEEHFLLEKCIDNLYEIINTEKNNK